jgi:hypothetical protein
MGAISRTADLFYTFRFLKLLVTPWEETSAFKHGIVDSEGNTLRRVSELKTNEERSSYTMFHRLVYNIKRLLNKVPFGKSRIASYAAALYLLKESTRMTDEQVMEIANRIDGIDLSPDQTLKESSWMLTKDGKLQPGTYTLAEDCVIVHTGEPRAYRGSTVTITEEMAPHAQIFGVPVFYVKHDATHQVICISLEDIKR